MQLISFFKKMVYKFACIDKIWFMRCIWICRNIILFTRTCYVNMFKDHFKAFYQINTSLQVKYLCKR